MASLWKCWLLVLAVFTIVHQEVSSASTTPTTTTTTTTTTTPLVCRSSPTSTSTTTTTTTTATTTTITTTLPITTTTTTTTQPTTSTTILFTTTTPVFTTTPVMTTTSTAIAISSMTTTMTTTIGPETTTTKAKNKKVPIKVLRRFFPRPGVGFQRKAGFKTGCLRSCYGIRNGKYPSCLGCNYIAVCYHGNLFLRKCYPGYKWDAYRRTCTFYSSTCSKLIRHQSFLRSRYYG